MTGRIKAAVVLAGRETPGSGQYCSRIITPVLLVHGDADYNVTYGDGRRPTPAPHHPASS